MVASIIFCFEVNLLMPAPVYISETGFDHVKKKEVMMWTNLKNCWKRSGYL